ncbi:MAG: DUF2384 domain-containing protein [Proteobacteria bacterium]|nr:DUF2384 domain-containing protein [Pseudomonadota bacterium]
MLTNYDADAVAEVMGIAFLEDPAGGPAPAAKPARSSKAVAGADTRKFVINLDHDLVRIVEIRTKGTFGRFEKSKSGTDRSLMDRKLTRRPPSSVLIEKAVEKGLPRLVLRHVAEQIAGTDEAKISSLEWVIVPKTTLERREEQLSPLESERTERAARLFVHARRALGSAAEARAFMTLPHPLLDGRTPIDAARTDLGTRRAEQILNALEYGLAL